MEDDVPPEVLRPGLGLDVQPAVPPARGRGGDELELEVAGHVLVVGRPPAVGIGLVEPRAAADGQGGVRVVGVVGAPVDGGLFPDGEGESLLRFP